MIDRNFIFLDKPRIPRKIKKAITRPCTKSKWLAKSKCFTNRLWHRYCERTMQPGQCRTLQARLYHYLVLNGCKYSWRNQTLKCEMPSGVKLSIFPVPKYHNALYSWYGAILYPYRKLGRMKYLDESGAKHLYKRLGEQIKEKVEQLTKGGYTLDPSPKAKAMVQRGEVTLDTFHEHEMVLSRGQQSTLANMLNQNVKGNKTMTDEEKMMAELEAEIVRYVGYQQEVDEDVSTTMIRKSASHFAAWQREQIMKDATTETVEDAGGRYLQIGPIGLDDEFVANNNLHPGDKVKVKIIKKE